MVETPVANARKCWFESHRQRYFSPVFIYPQIFKTYEYLCEHRHPIIIVHLVIYVIRKILSNLDPDVLQFEVRRNWSSRFSSEQSGHAWGASQFRSHVPLVLSIYQETIFSLVPKTWSLSSNVQAPFTASTGKNAMLCTSAKLSRIYEKQATS